MSLDTLLEDTRKRDIIPPRQSVIGIAERAGKVFDISTQKGISIEEADSEILISELVDFNKTIEETPLHTDMDGLIDVFDPSEPPKLGEGIANPMGDLAKAELATIRESLKWAFKASSYIFAPVNRAFKFLTNATMYEPLTKSVAGPLRAHLVQTAIREEKFKVVQEEAIKVRKKQGLPITLHELRGQKLSSVLSEERIAELVQGVDQRASSIIKAEQEEIEELPKVEVGDFLKSGLDALKTLVPWPGFADDVKSRGEIAADSYGRIVGREAPFYYSVVTDITEQTIAMGGLLKIANSAQVAKNAPLTNIGAKLTRAEIKAIKKLHKAQSRITKAPITSNIVPSPTDASTVTAKLIDLIKKAKPLRDKKALLLHKERQVKAAKLFRAQKAVKGERLVKATKVALKGKAPVPDFTPLNTQFTAPEIDALFNLVNNSKISGGFDKGNAILSLDRLLHGKLITKSEIGNLERVFGTALTKALFRKQDIASIIQDVAFEVINLPRAILASFDLSAAGRQGIIFSVSHPVASMKAFGRSVRAAKSLKYSDEIEKVTRNNKWGKLADRFGIHSSPTGFAAKVSSKEEPYLSRIAERIPGIAQSERAFTTFLNQQRREVFTIQAQKWIKVGITPKSNPEVFQQYATFVNHATGRGSLENLSSGTLTALNATFFSPRFQISRVQVIGDLISPKTTAIARKVIARDLAEFYITGMGMLAMAKMGGAEVELDPRSSDFGKIKVGNTRYNYWGAFQPLATLAGRMYFGEIKSTSTGKIRERDRFNLSPDFDNIIGAFLRTKFAPVPGAIADIVTGETPEGEPISLAGVTRGETVLEKVVTSPIFKSLAPLFFQDSVDAWLYQGMDAQFPLSAGLAFTGIGVQTWEISPFAELELQRDSLARQTYGKNYDELSFPEVNILDADILINHHGITELEREAKFNSNSVNFLQKQALELRKSEKRLEKKLNKQLFSDLNNIKLRVGGIDRTVGNWRLNDEQYKEYEERIARNINELFRDMKPLWDTKNTEGKFELMHTLLRSARLLSANEMKIGDME